jgi:hypothetical protein
MVRPSTLVAAFPPVPTFLVLYGVLPLVAIITYVLLYRSASVRNRPRALAVCLFPLVFCWAGIVFVGFTALSGHWFGLASIVMFFLLLISPLIFIPVTLILWRIAREVRVARVALYACFGYYLVIAAGWTLFVGPWPKQ